MTRHGTEGQTLDTNTSTSDKQYEQLNPVNNGNIIITHTVLTFQ